MKNENTSIIRNILETDFALFDLKIKASQIKNNCDVKNSINSLIGFIDAQNLRFTNP